MLMTNGNTTKWDFFVIVEYINQNSIITPTQ